MSIDLDHLMHQKYPAYIVNKATYNLWLFAGLPGETYLEFLRHTQLNDPEVVTECDRLMEIEKGE